MFRQHKRPLYMRRDLQKRPIHKIKRPIYTKWYSRVSPQQHESTFCKNIERMCGFFQCICVFTLCMHIYIYIKYKYIYKYIYTHTYIYIYTYLSIYIHIYLHIYTYIYTYRYTYIYIYVYYTCVCVCVCVCVHVHIQYVCSTCNTVDHDFSKIKSSTRECLFVYIGLFGWSVFIYIGLFSYIQVSFHIYRSLLLSGYAHFRSNSELLCEWYVKKQKKDMNRPTEERR